MKNIKTKIILSAIVLLSVVGFVGTVDAASLYVSPATASNTVGSVISASVGLNTAGSKVCAVEGTLVFNGLTCQSITVSGDVMVQASPTCSNPKFLLGIPNCTTSNMALLTVLVKAGSAGSASISVAGVDVIGEGSSVGSASANGSYTISAVPVVTPVVTPTPKVTQEVTTSTQEIVQEVVTPTEEVTQAENNITKNLGTASLLGAGAKWYNYFAIALAIIVIFYGIYYFAIKRKKE